MSNIETLRRYIGHRVADERNAVGLTVLALSDLTREVGAGVSRQSIALIESGDVLPSIATLHWIAKALSLEISDLLPEGGSLDMDGDQWTWSLVLMSADKGWKDDAGRKWPFRVQFGVQDTAVWRLIVSWNPQTELADAAMVRGPAGPGPVHRDIAAQVLSDGAILLCETTLPDLEEDQRDTMIGAIARFRRIFAAGAA